MISLDNIFLVLKIHPHENGEVHNTICGKFIFSDTEGFSVLEDHCGFLSDLENKSSEEISRVIASLNRGMYYKVVSMKSYKDGFEVDSLPEIQQPHTTVITNSYTYIDESGNELSLDFQGNKAFLDDFEISEEEAKTLLDRVHSGSARVIKKSEFEEEDLQKGNDALEAALRAVKEAVKNGSVHSDHLRTIQKEIYTDSMVPGVGNKKAYNDFLSRPKKGVYVHMDGNDFGQINKKFGFEMGNHAIKAFGSAMRSAMDESVGRGKGKLHRAGGDEFMAFVPSHEDAAHFASKLREKLDSIPHIGGTHKLSVSMGVGENPDHAEVALIRAKGEKKKSGKLPGQADTHVHVLKPEPPAPKPQTVLPEVATTP